MLTTIPLIVLCCYWHFSIFLLLYWCWSHFLCSVLWSTLKSSVSATAIQLFRWRNTISLFRKAYNFNFTWIWMQFILILVIYVRIEQNKWHSNTFSFSVKFTTTRTSHEKSIWIFVSLVVCVINATDELHQIMWLNKVKLLRSRRKHLFIDMFKPN